MREEQKIIRELLSIIDYGLIAKPDHICGSPDARCDCDCENYFNQEKIITKAKQFLKAGE